MSKEQHIAELKTKMDSIMKEYSAEYEALADRSEKLCDQKEALGKAYKALDAKTGFNSLSEELASLVESE